MTADLAREARERVTALRETAADCRNFDDTTTAAVLEEDADLLTRLAAALDGAPAAPDGLVKEAQQAAHDLAFAHWNTTGPASNAAVKACGVIDRLIAALRAPTPAPEPGDWVRVPKQPTEEMIEAGWIDKEDVSPAEIYHAMLTAAPSEPAQDAGLIERAARAVYELFPYDGPKGTSKPAWVPNGNSLKQGEARQYARAVLAALPAPTPAPESVKKCTDPKACAAFEACIGECEATPSQPAQDAGLIERAKDVIDGALQIAPPEFFHGEWGEKARDVLTELERALTKRIAIAR